MALVALFLLLTAGTAAAYERGVASVYAEPQRLSDGSRLNPSAWTCAHPKAGTKTMPIGTCIEVRNGDLSAHCVVLDNGPHIKGRVLDMTPRVAEAIGFSGLGVVDFRKVDCQ